MSDLDSRSEKHVNTHNTPIVDVESLVGQSEEIRQEEFSAFRRISEKLDSLGVEERGLQRVMPDQRTEHSTLSYIWLTFLW